MRFPRSLLLPICLAFVQAYPTQNTNNSSIVLSAQEQTELSPVIASLQQFNQELGFEKRHLFDKRSNIPVLDKVLTLLNDTNIANIVINHVLLSPTLLDLSTNATIFVLRLNLVNYDNLFIAIEKSGLVNQLILAALDNPNTLPGVLRLIDDLLKDNGINFSSLTSHKRQLDFETFAPVERRESKTLTKRESELLDELFTSLRDSGLVVSVVSNLLTNPDLAAPSAQFLTEILRSGAISVPEVLQALIESGALINILKDVLTDRAILEKVAQIVVDRISKGIIPKNLSDQIFHQ
ncbi:hypothetical protein PSN45_001637 [Yamadazyma tenuis]|uniref:Uncharacterized protein n=1 Tax=Candida tenuis (strain ATCC 10573 / BCRC 21748 / CBS 615 / JCM 9827 / NBRC 10315 / NRRL Y-1498 / VKM Y-70) TaxID=590646 RepID=G3BEU2_CANTC|nr:uncharacterized protein CANTEDRAFT_137075 [Yamadazyma tenuis ATCC 10573]EGV60593.1 hypothetical protein CANTEDRAFT_137075 [Yamadazyma tenuis ATCC 10573]WEJ94158.1 hypothetical protein PSN45_001637 [Yamadazyma tenuis]